MSKPKPFYQKNVSDAEAMELSKPLIDDLNAFVERTNHSAVEAGRPLKKAEKEVDELSAKLRSYLESVFDFPLLNATTRRDELGLSTNENTSIKRELLKLGLVEEVSVNLGPETSGIAKFLELTEGGYQALGKPAPKTKRRNCSAEHWFWQKRLREYFCSRNLETEIEMTLNGKAVDVGYIRDGVKVAVEVAITPKNEVVNVKKNLEAGFDRVVIACKNTSVLRAVERNLKGVLSDQEIALVKVMALYEFEFVKGLGFADRGKGTNSVRD